MGTTRTLNGSTKRGDLTRDLGSTGLNEQGGRIQDDFLRSWNGARKVANIDEMLSNSAAVAALRLAIEMPARDVDWLFSGPNGEDDPVLDLLRESLDNMTHSFNDHITDCLEMVFYGWSMLTIKYEQKNGRWMWRKLKALGHDTVDHWIFDKDGGLLGLQQLRWLWPEPIPIDRMLLYRFRKSRGSPEGRSILRPAWPAYFYAKNIMKIEAIGIERNLNGLPMIEPPMNADMSEGSQDLDTAKKIVRNVRQDEQGGVILPPPTGEREVDRWHFDLISGGGLSKAIDTNMVISRYEKRILMSSLAQFIMLGMDNIGAMATFEGATDFFTMLVNALLDIIAETFTKFGITRLLELNGIDPDGYQLEHSPAGDIGLNIIADFLQKVSPMLTITAEDEVWLRSISRMPDKTVEAIEAERMEKEAKAAAMQRAISQGGLMVGQNGNGQNGRQGQNGQRQPGQNGQGAEQNTAGLDWYAADLPDDNEQRMENERVMNEALVGFLSKQKGRVLNGAMELRRGRV